MRKCAGLVFLLALAGCGGGSSTLFSGPGGGLGAPGPDAEANRGQVVSYSLIQDYGSLSMDTALSYIESQSGISLSVTSDVSLYKVTYWTIDLNGNMVQATGAVAIPD